MRRQVEEYIRSVSSKDFEWGEHDCLQLVGGLVEAVDGFNPAARFKGRYSDEFGANMILWREYHGYLPKALSEELVAAEGVSFGCIALVHVQEKYAAGIVQDRSVLILHQGKGLIALPLSCVEKVYLPKCRK